MTALAKLKEEQEAVQYSEWVDKWQEIECDMQYNVPWKKLYGYAPGKSWTTAEKNFWNEYFKFVTEVYNYQGTLEELKRRITDQRIYNSRTYKSIRF